MIESIEKLREKLDALGIEHFDYDKGGRTQTMWESPDGKRHFTYETSDNPAKTARLVIAWHPTPEQAIAATLGSDKPPYDELLRCLENDWHISASWDGLRKFWCFELTEEGVRMRDARAERGTLTADDIRGLIERHSDESGGNGRDFHNGAYVAIADELNARAERTCEEIVRCRDCAKADYAEVHMFDGTRPKKWTCTRFGCFHHMVKPDGFCSRGARREP